MASPKSANTAIQLPRDSINRIKIGHSFAEYDLVRDHPSLTVITPAIRAATSKDVTKCFFVGRRGTGKTAISYFLKSKIKNAREIIPQIICPSSSEIPIEQFRDTRQRPFRAIVASFKRALLAAMFEQWRETKLLGYEIPKELGKEFRRPDHEDFDLNLLNLIEESLGFLKSQNEKEFLKFMKREGTLLALANKEGDTSEFKCLLLIDRIDECWDGSDEAVIFLMALMHACVELNSTCRPLRIFLFLRENIFDRVREINNEFARLETWLVSLEWSDAHLVELIERRLMLPFNTKLPLGGATWDYFFESLSTGTSRDYVLNYCQKRPRDVVTFCALALDSAQSRKHDKITFEDMQAARRRFSDNRLTDLCDEYTENYPQIELVIGNFHGLCAEFTLNGLTAFVQKLLADEEVGRACKSWIYKYAAPELFAELLYRISFFGLKDGNDTRYRGLGTFHAQIPTITSSSHFVVHPTFVEALNLQERILDALPESWNLRQSGAIIDIPDAINLEDYYSKLSALEENLRSVPVGDEHSAAFEDIVGDVLKLCFFRWLTNLEPKKRNHNGRVIRDWIAANTATAGFWEAMRVRYNALQVIWECKNYKDIGADEFQQAAYYITSQGGKLVVITYRGSRERKRHHYEHIQRIAAQQDGIVLLVNDQDLMTFIRQSQSGKSRDSHIRAIYDETIRAIS